MTSNATKTVTAVLLLVGLLSGCTSVRPESTPAVAPARLSEEAIDLVTSSGAVPVQMWRVQVADEKLTERCMWAAGFTWTGSAQPPAPRRDAAQMLADARRNGYGMSDVDPEAGPEPGAAPDPRMLAALIGPEEDRAELVIDGRASYSFPRTGCLADAHTAIYGSLDTWARISYIPQEINVVLGGQARTDDRYQAALQGWRACMAAHGHAYESPLDLVERLAAAYPADRRPLARRRAAETRLAVQDVTCNQQAGLSTTEDKLRREYANRLSAKERAELTELTRLFVQAWHRSLAPPPDRGRRAPGVAWPP